MEIVRYKTVAPLKFNHEQALEDIVSSKYFDGNFDT